MAPRCVCAVLLALLSGLSLAQAQLVSVTPAEYPDGMTNPLMGFRDRVSNAAKGYPYVTLVRDYVYYNAIEGTASDGVDKIRDYTNTTYRDFEKHNVKVIPRVILIWDETRQYWPADLPYDWTTEALKARVLEFVARLGVAWNNDPRIAFIETGLIGKWGEQESPVGVDDPVVGSAGQTWAAILGPAFKAAFPNKKCLVRGMEKWADDFEPGVYWDSYGAWSKMNGPTDNYPEILRYNRPPYERYKKAPMEGEVAYSMSDPAQLGTSEDETVQNADYRGWLIDNIRATHSTTCGIEYDHQNTANNTGASLIQREFGYRFLIKKFEFAPRVTPGGTLSISATIVNAGSAPVYENWPLAFVLISEATHEIVFKSIIPAVDITTWYPGSNYDWTPQASPSFGTGSRRYLTPAPESVVSASIAIPASVPVGQYLAGLSILDPTTLLPGIFFSVPNFLQRSNAQPLCRIGVGVDASSSTLSSALFDAYDWSNDTRSYGLTYPPTHVNAIDGARGTRIEANVVSPAGVIRIAHGDGAFVRVFDGNGRTLLARRVSGTATSIRSAELGARGFVLVHVTSVNGSTVFRVCVTK